MKQFIDMLAPYAISHGRAMNILPSLIIAQGILETGGGTSALAINANNLFGIKKGMAWDGEVHAVKTSEYTADDVYYEIVAEFRKYDSYEGSVIDLCEKYNTMTRYAAVPGNFVFDDVAQAVKDAGYATDPNYPAKLKNIYEVYDLGQYDVGFVNEIIKEETEMAITKVVIDAGHFPNTPGKRSPIGEREWYFNDTVAKACIAQLERYEDIEILRVDSSAYDVPLNTRTAKANSWGGALYVSIHHNANLGVWGTWSGTETYVYSATTSSDGSMRLAKEVHPRIVKAMGLKDRGIKRANFAVLRTTRMPAILTEGGYMDSSIDIQVMRNSAKMKSQGVAIADGIAAYAGKKLMHEPVQASRPTSLFRVRKAWTDDVSQLGAYSDIDGAVAVAKANGGYQVYASDGKQVYPAIQNAPSPTVDDLFRVRKSWGEADSQLGAFADLVGAKELADRYLTHNVFDGTGRLVYDPSAAKAAREAAEREKEEARIKAEADAKKEAERLAKFEEARKAKERYEAEFAKAIEIGITDGTNPKDAATREQVAVMIVRALGLMK